MNFRDALLLPVRRTAFLLLLVAALPAVADDVFQQLRDGGASRVVEIVDGDTVILADQREIRLVGLQAPKLPLGRKNFKKWPMADDAKTALAKLILEQRVWVGFGGREMDRHGRYLGHLFLDENGRPGLWVQGAMLAKGMARTYTFYDNRALIAEMYEKERQARDGNRGIWRLNYYRVRHVGELDRDFGSFQLVEGTPLRVAEVRGKVFINYGQDWRRDFTLTISQRARQSFRKAEYRYQDLVGRRLRVRGWVKSWNGPMIDLTHPEQIEILD